MYLNDEFGNWGRGPRISPFLILPDLRFPIRNGVGVMTNCQIHLYQRYAFRIAIAPVLGFNPY